MLKVSFGDNDFGYPIKLACEYFLETHIGVTAKRHEGEKAFVELLDKVGMAAIRDSLVVAAWGYYVVDGSIWWDLVDKSYVKSPDTLNVDRHKKTLDYLNERIKIEVVQEFNDDGWENAETCYIDFFNGEVYLK
jgi:hypothetical protein